MKEKEDTSSISLEEDLKGHREENLQATQEQKYYKMMLNMTGNAYCEWDEESGFHSSEAYEKYAISANGYEGLMGRGDSQQFIHPSDIPIVKHYMKEMVNNTLGKSITIRMRLKDGRYRWTEVVAYAEVKTNGKYRKIAAVFRDVDKEWIERNQKLQEALEAAEQANKAKTVFLSRVSHDMRTPLNAILGLTSFLKESVTDEKAAEDIDQLEISGQYLLNLINDTLDMSRIENGKLELHPTVCDTKTTFENIMKLAKASAESKSIHLSLINMPYRPRLVLMDVGRVEQVMMNIIGNAIKFTPDGGTVEIERDDVSETPEDMVVSVSITDTGIGISPEFMPNIFEPFSQADESKTNTQQGTGLGLAISKQLIELMDGTIEVKSKLGKGTKFIITLQFPKANNQQRRDWYDGKYMTTDTSRIKGKRVLLCEDQPLNSQIATRILEAKDIQVDCAFDGKKGVDMFEKSEEHYYDFILMDVRMPVMDGIDATRIIRRLDRIDACTVPIIAMTGNSFDEEVQTIIEAGMNTHLSKPIEWEHLFEEMSRLDKEKPVYRRKSVLIVDDVEMNRAMAKEALSDDYDVLEAEDGQQALELVKTKEIDVIISDVMMMNMGGIDLVKMLKSKEKYQQIPIIINTQYEEYAQKEELQEMGVEGFISKPNTPEQIRRQVGKVLKK